MKINVKAIANSFFFTNKERKENYKLYSNKCLFGECHPEFEHDCNDQKMFNKMFSDDNMIS